MTHDYKKALSIVKTYKSYIGTDASISPDVANTNTIIKALELAIALQPKPISKAPVNKAVFNGGTYIMNRPRGDWIVLQTGRVLEEQPTHFYDISALPKPEET